MICKKCGANIADTSKFCGYCGAQVEQDVSQVQSNADTLNSVNMGQIQNTFDNVGQIIPNINSDESISEPSIQSFDNQPLNVNNNLLNNENLINNNVDSNTQLNSTVSNSNINQSSTFPPMENQIQLSNNQPTIQNQSNQPINQNVSNKKKSGKGGVLIAVVSVIVICAIVGVVAVLGINNKKDTPIVALRKTLGNIENKANMGATIKANILIESSTNDSMNFSADFKYAKDKDGYNVAVTLNKSLLYDEIELYSIINNQNITLYTKSNVVDLFGLTKSLEDIWLYLDVPLDEINIKNWEQSNTNIDILDIIDEKHVTFIDEVDGIRHYQLIIDKQLIDKNKDKLSDEEYDEIVTMFDVNDSYSIDYYINKLNELKKVSIEISDLGEDIEISRIVLSFELSDLNSTSVTIPTEALDSTESLDDYMNTYAIQSDNGTTDETQQLDESNNDVIS